MRTPRLGRKKKDHLPIKIIVTVGGGDSPFPIYDEDNFLAGGDTLVINLPDEALVLCRGHSSHVPIRLKFRGGWYEVGRRIYDP